MSYIAKGGRRLALLLEGYRGKAAPLLCRGLGEGAVDAGGSKDPHRGLQRPQIEAEDEVFTDTEVVAEGECPPVPGEDGIAPAPRMISIGQRSSGLLCSTSTTSPVEQPRA
jgi:hypothetical protein